ncbi:MAG: NIPSNAP family protein [Pirellulales bacterium]
MKRLLPSAAYGLLAAAIVAAAVAGVARSDDKPEAGRLFELRTYTTNDGKLAELHKRFRDHTNRLFVKHGMTLVGYWTPAEGPEADNTLVYVLAYPSREARDKSWKAFMADPEWQAAYKASHASGPLVKNVKSQFLNPTDYSPIR